MPSNKKIMENPVPMIKVGMVISPDAPGIKNPTTAEPSRILDKSMKSFLIAVYSILAASSTCIQVTSSLCSSELVQRGFAPMALLNASFCRIASLLPLELPQLYGILKFHTINYFALQYVTHLNLSSTVSRQFRRLPRRRQG